VSDRVGQEEKFAVFESRTIGGTCPRPRLLHLHRESVQSEIRPNRRGEPPQRLGWVRWRTVGRERRRHLSAGHNSDLSRLLLEQLVTGGALSLVGPEDTGAGSQIVPDVSWMSHRPDQSLTLFLESVGQRREGRGG